MQTRPFASLSTVRRRPRSLALVAMVAACLIPSLPFPGIQPAFAAQADLKQLSVNGATEDGKARLVFEATIDGTSRTREKPLVATTLEHHVAINRERQLHTLRGAFEILQGVPEEIALTLSGEGEIQSVTGERLLDWSVRRDTNGLRSLILRPRPSDKPLISLQVTVLATHNSTPGDLPVDLLAFASPSPALGSGHLRLDLTPDLELEPRNPSGLIPIDPSSLPESLRSLKEAQGGVPLAFRFHGSAYRFPILLRFADPESGRVVLHNAELRGTLTSDTAAFSLTASARVRGMRGGSLVLLNGGVALSTLENNSGWRLLFTNQQYVAVFDAPGDYPLHLKFNAPVRRESDWNKVDFRVAASALQPIVLAGLAESTQLLFAGGAKPERIQDEFRSFLPPDGSVRLTWRDTRAGTEGRLFYAVDMLSQITLSPGLMRQAAGLTGRIMQGELNRLVLLVQGEGNVTAVQGPNVLAWSLEPTPTQGQRRLVVQFNQPQKESFTLQVQMQSQLGSFPRAVDAMRLSPEGATRFAGLFRVTNEGAVRLEILQSTGLSQVSPEQFPAGDTTSPLFAPPGNQRFVFRFSSANFALGVNADMVVPELSVSQVLNYHLGEAELSIDAEFELDIREAPLREVLLRVPRGFAIARLTAAGMSDHGLRDVEGRIDAELRILYAQPILDRQLIQVRLERNSPLGDPTWELPRVEVLKAKSIRGHLAVSADAGIRLTPFRTAGLTETAAAFLPRKVAGIQAGFRFTDPSWEALVRIERLPQSLQADAFHLFSIGEGIAYGSSTLHYLVSGAPVSALRLALSDEYFNVEFTGKEVRHWQKDTNGYVIHLNTPVSGAYTLLATYERPFKAQGDTLTFTGARPIDVQSEQGHTLVVSAFQFQVTPAVVSAGLLELETAEVPSEYRLFFDAPILKAYRYTARPFNLQLALKPMQQGETLGLVIDRAMLSTRISKEGDVVTDASYLIKNRGNPHLRITLPEGSTLWSATVNGNTVVPVKDGAASLIPLSQRADPSAVQTLAVKLASRSSNSSDLTVLSPIVGAPVLLAEWRLQPDSGQRLRYLGGSLRPVQGGADVSGFAGLVRICSRGLDASRLASSLVLIGLAIWACRRATLEGTKRLGARHVSSGLLALGAGGLATWMLLLLLMEARSAGQTSIPPGLTFLAPVQESGSALRVEVSTSSEEFTLGRVLALAWPAGLAVIVWGFAILRIPKPSRTLWIALGWTLMAWASLRWPHGASAFLGGLLVFLFLHGVIPCLRQLRSLPPRVTGQDAAVPSGMSTSLLVGGLFWFVSGSTVLAASATPSGAGSKDPAVALSVVQDIRVDSRFALAEAKIRVQGQKDQRLLLLLNPAVMTRVSYPTNALRWIESRTEAQQGQAILFQQDGIFDIQLEYQLQVSQGAAESGFALPTQPGLVNHLSLAIPDRDLDVASTNAVSVALDTSKTNLTIARLLLAPAQRSWISWKPRSRDHRREKPVFFAELLHLYSPVNGVIEGLHEVQLRPAQGELLEVVCDVPAGLTITDVFSSRKAADTNRPAPPLVSLWRFDPDTRRLKVTLGSPQSHPFSLTLRSQLSTGPLPFSQEVGLIRVQGAAGQLGAIGVGTGSEVQLDNASSETFTALPLEDFPASFLQPLQDRIPGLALRRAFRFADPNGVLRLQASPVEPDVRVESQQTLSLSEDRTVLAAKVEVEITRTGVFRLSFFLPPLLDVESLSGKAMSHWTELKTPEGRIVTLHLKGKTEGTHSFNLSLTGPGVRPTTNALLPRLTFREAAKQRGQLVIVPEQGMRLSVATREGVTQLDPQKSGIRQKSVLAFRLLQSDWRLGVDIEQIDAWVQVTSLQHVTVSEAQLQMAANLQYHIENTGLKSMQVELPADAESVRFRGEEIADFLKVEGGRTNSLQTWEVKLHRRIIGNYLLQATWQIPLVGTTTNASVGGIRAVDANLQRGFVTVQAGGRLQLRVGALPAALQSAEWQSIPRTLMQDVPSASAHFSFRLVEPTFQLPLVLERHEATKLLPAHVTGVTLNSVVSDDGVMLTQVRLEMVPGDKRLLSFSLPKDSIFWFAFLNQNGVWPWREQDKILIPLERPSRIDQPAVVELFYSSRGGTPTRRSLDLEMVAPRFDLPLENITWQVSLNEARHLAKWGGTLQLQQQSTVGTRASVNVQSYLEGEAVQNRAKTKAAEDMLSLGNSLLEQGNPQQARHAFQSAFGLSAHDSAFNEDARVQLHNLKLQQALVGLNVRQSVTAGAANAPTNSLKEFRNRKDLSYTQQEAKQLLNANNSDDNAALMRLAERIVQQQDAVITAPSAIRANIPQQGRMLTFRRTLQIDPTADLKITLRLTTPETAPLSARFGILAGTFAALSALAWGARGKRR